MCATFLLAACATVGDARRWQDQRNEPPGERTPTAKELGLATSGPLELDEALRIALAVHPSILRARRLEDEARTRVSEVEAAFLPALSASATRQYRDQKSSGPKPPGSHRFESLGFGVSWLLFDFGRTSALARQAAAQWLAAQKDTRTALLDVAFNVRSAYFNLSKEIELRDVARDAVRQFQEHLDQVHEFVKVGTHIPYDETKAQVDLGSAKQTLVQEEDAVLLDEATLASAMGLAEVADWTPKSAATSAAAPPPFEECWAQAQRELPALASARALEQAADELVNAGIDALYPQLSLGFGYSAAGSSLPLPWSWQVGPSLSWVPFDGFQNLYSIDEAVAALRAARNDVTSAEQAAWLDARTAWLAIEDARRQLDLALLQVQYAEDNLTLAQGRFDNGKATAVDLTDARQALIAARAAQVQARAQYDIATAKLQKSMGAGSPDAPAARPDGGAR